MPRRISLGGCQFVGDGAAHGEVSDIAVKMKANKADFRRTGPASTAAEES